MTSVLIGTETMLLALLALVVVALLRSHAEILRRLEQLGAGGELPTPARRVAGDPAHAISGLTPGGDANAFSLGAGSVNTLLAFFSSGCSSCAALLEHLAEAATVLPGVDRLIVVTKDRDEELPVRFQAAERICDVVMSSQAWRDYGVPGSPYFAFVDGASGIVVGEGSAPTWPRVARLLQDMHDEHDATRHGTASRIDEELASAGLHPGDPSLYPTRR